MLGFISLTGQLSDDQRQFSFTQIELYSVKQSIYSVSTKWDLHGMFVTWWTKKQNQNSYSLINHFVQ